ncbi:MAG: tetraacyldisaccharide 4'-kinase, partial [Pseudomonadota bacterium]
MKAPAHWSRPPQAPGILARLLSPATALWRLGSAVRAHLMTTEIAPVPVLCVGNLTAGGAGKTPMVASLLRRLEAKDVKAHVVSRGYGGRIDGPHRVDITKDNAGDVGDEPLMLAAMAPVWVARNRVEGARAAAAAGAELVILDDGFQNPGLMKDAAIVMVDAMSGFGNARLIPAGPLREPVLAGLERADLIVLVGDQDSRARALQTWPA